MQKLNLIHKEKSDISYDIFTFPDGEIQIKLGEINRKDVVKVICRITNTNELFIILQVCNILDRQAVEYDIHCTYLMGMRMDRVMDFNRPFTLEVIANLFKNTKAGVIRIETPHSDAIYRFPKFTGVEAFNQGYKFKTQYQIVLPDEGAAYRNDLIIGYTHDPVIYCKKVRDPETGKLSEFKINNPEDINKRASLMIIDDLCDGGGTFCGLANEFKKIDPNININLSVIHAVNINGIKKVCDVFNQVYITNSYKDWDKVLGDDCPSNLTIMDVLTHVE